MIVEGEGRAQVARTLGAGGRWFNPAEGTLWTGAANQRSPNDVDPFSLGFSGAGGRTLAAGEAPVITSTEIAQLKNALTLARHRFADTGAPRFTMRSINPRTS